MRNKGAIISIFCLAALGFGLFLTDFWLGMRNSRYSQLIEEFECGYLPEDPCKGDFDGDGRLTQIELKRHHDALVELPPHFAGNKHEGVLNIFSLDNTLRTHVGVRSESGRAHLIIYDGSGWPSQMRTVRDVYAWHGDKWFEMTPTETDMEILSAMAARDDTGTFHQWVIYYLLVWPTRVVYVSLFLAAALVYRKYWRRNS